MPYRSIRGFPTYQGAPPRHRIHGLGHQVAAFGGLLRASATSVSGEIHKDWEPILWAVAIATMLIGAIMAVTQSDIKRMLAYSSITHAGFLLLESSPSMNTASRQPCSTLRSTAFRRSAHSPPFPSSASRTARRPHLSGREATDISQWAGLGKRYPFVGAMFSMFLLAFAGYPLTSGFIASSPYSPPPRVLGADPRRGRRPLQRHRRLLLHPHHHHRHVFTDPPTTHPISCAPSILTTAGIAACTVVTILLGILPNPSSTSPNARQFH